MALNQILLLTYLLTGT